VGQISVNPEISTMKKIEEQKSNNIINSRIDLGLKWQGNKCVGMRSERTKGIAWFI